MNNMIIACIPPEIEKYTEYLGAFLDGMLVKLVKNAHKDTPTMKSIPEIIENLREEVIEFEEQLALDKFDENTLVELFDTANFALRGYVALRLQEVEHE